MFPRIESLLCVNNLEYLIEYLNRKIYDIENIKKTINKKDFIVDYDSILLFLKTELKNKKEILEGLDKNDNMILKTNEKEGE